MNLKELAAEFSALNATVGQLERRMDAIEEGGRIQSHLDAVEADMARLREEVL